MPESGTSDTPSALNEHSVAEPGGLAAAGGAGAAVLAGVTPQSTTADLAGAVPKEVEKPAEEESDKHAATVPDAPESSISPPGAFPETPANETQEFSVKPIPASDGIGNPVSVPAGEKLPDPSAINANTVDSTATTSKEGYEKDASAALPVAAAAAGVGLAGAFAHDEKSDADSFGVSPIPASSGIGNLISVPAGEKLPEQSSFNPNTVQSTVTTSEEGYERDASAPLMPPSAIADATGTGAAAAADSAFSVPEKSTNMIPESSLPMDGEVKYTTDTGPTISSVAPTSTTAQMASTVPLEPKREVMIIDDEVPSATLSGPAPTVPEMVKESLSEAHQSPEAAASPEAVEEKALVENELLKKVASTDATGEPAPSPDAAGTHSAPVSSVASNVPAVVKESISEAHQPAEAAAAQEVVNEKKDVESELLRTVKSTDAAGEPAPTTVAATTEIAPKATSEAAVGGDTAGATTLVSPTNASDVPAHAAPDEAATPHASVEAPTTAATTTEKGEVSPASPGLNPPATPAKAIATGDAPTKSTVGHTTAETTPTPSTTASPASTAAKETKHKKRRSFFGKLKDRLKDL
jgi:hypothetical protein